MSARRIVPAPRRALFAFLSDLENQCLLTHDHTKPLVLGGPPGARRSAVVRVRGGLTLRRRGAARIVAAFEPNELVTYRSTQRGLPDAYHERHFDRDGDGFVYGLVVEYEPRSGMQGLLDRSLLRLGIRRAFRRTFADLAREFDARAA